MLFKYDFNNENFPHSFVVFRRNVSKKEEKLFYYRICCWCFLYNSSSFVVKVMCGSIRGAMTKDALKKTCCIFLLFYFRRIQTRNRNRNRIIVISNVFMLFFVWAHRIHLPLTHHIHMHECVAKRESCSKQFSLHEQNNRIFFRFSSQ